MPLIEIPQINYGDPIDVIVDKVNDSFRQIDWLAKRMDAQNIAPGAITTDLIALGAVTTSILADSAVTGDKLVDLSITVGKLADASITTEKLANLAVDSTKLANLAVIAAKLADSSVTATKIANAAVGSAAIANAAIGTAHIANGVIQTAHIGNAQITDAKIASITADKITAGTLDASLIYIKNDLILGTSAADVNNMIKFNRNATGPTLMDYDTNCLQISAQEVTAQGYWYFVGSAVDFNNTTVYGLSTASGGSHNHGISSGTDLLYGHWDGSKWVIDGNVNFESSGSHSHSVS